MTYGKNEDGFTLVEMAVVLVIIGLLIGGVVVGQSMIRSSQLQQVSTQYTKFLTATKQFKQKYGGLPGDMADATSYWGVAASGTACATASSAGGSTLTCDGDGDGFINYANPNSNESFRYWQQLVNAGLLVGSYDGVQDGSTNYSVTAANSPTGPLSNTGWWVYNKGVDGGGANAFQGAYYNSYIYGALASNTSASAPMLTPAEALNIDTKLDDGKPATGKVAMLGTGGTTPCSDSADTSNMNANYNVSNTGTVCALFFRTLF